MNNCFFKNYFVCLSQAPTHVTSILKTLVEDGEMLLADGRRLAARSFEAADPLDKTSNIIIPIHPDFRMIVLANRPGFPFLGNDFYREIGDVFSAHAVDNPDSESEMFLLRKYAPSVPEETLAKLSNAFADLRHLVDEGQISYPYSTRELVNIVRHMEKYPEEGISRILQNVFDFDQYEREVKDLLIRTLQRHGIPVGLESDFKVVLGAEVPLPEPVLAETWLPVPAIPAVAAEAAQCIVSETDLPKRGMWKLKDAVPEPLERNEGRSVIFTEQLYGFKVPTRGHVLDVLCTPDGTVHAITTEPITLFTVGPQHRQVSSMDLYEYFPLMGPVAPRLRLAMLDPNGSQLVLHNPQDNSLLGVDVHKRTVFAVSLPQFTAYKTSVMLSELAPSTGRVVLFQDSTSQIVVMDFNLNKTYTVKIKRRNTQTNNILRTRSSCPSSCSRSIWSRQTAGSSKRQTSDSTTSCALPRPPKQQPASCPHPSATCPPLSSRSPSPSPATSALCRT